MARLGAGVDPCRPDVLLLAAHYRSERDDLVKEPRTLAVHLLVEGTAADADAARKLRYGHAILLNKGINAVAHILGDGVVSVGWLVAVIAATVMTTPPPVAVLDLHIDPTAVVRLVVTVAVDTVDGACATRSVFDIPTLNCPIAELFIVVEPCVTHADATRTVVPVGNRLRVVAAVLHAVVDGMEPALTLKAKSVCCHA